jgi:hypothetical protein
LVSKLETIVREKKLFFCYAEKELFLFFEEREAFKIEARKQQ